MVSTHVISKCSFCILVAHFKSWLEPSKVMGMINIFVHDYKHSDIYSSITFKGIHQLHLKKFMVEIKYNLNDYTAIVRGSQVKWTLTNTRTVSLHYRSFLGVDNCKEGKRCVSGFSEYETIS